MIRRIIYLISLIASIIFWFAIIGIVLDVVNSESVMTTLRVSALLFAIALLLPLLSYLVGYVAYDGELPETRRQVALMQWMLLTHRLLK
jgi:hypothetical protein